MSGTVVSLRLPEALVAEVDAKSGRGGRTGWIQSAIEERLGRETVDALVGAEPDVAPGVSRADLARDVTRGCATGDDARDVENLLSTKRMSVRDVAKVLGWTERRVEAAVKMIGPKVRWDRGVMEIAS